MEESSFILIPYSLVSGFLNKRLFFAAVIQEFFKRALFANGIKFIAIDDNEIVLKSNKSG